MLASHANGYQTNQLAAILYYIILYYFIKSLLSGARKERPCLDSRMERNGVSQW